MGGEGASEEREPVIRYRLPENPSHLFTARASSVEVERGAVTGWALPKLKRSNRFSERVKSFLLAQFMNGEETGRRVTPVEAATRMCLQRDENGNLKFWKERANG